MLINVQQYLKIGPFLHHRTQSAEEVATSDQTFTDNSQNLITWQLSSYYRLKDVLSCGLSELQTAELDFIINLKHMLIFQSLLQQKAKADILQAENHKFYFSPLN